MFRKFVCCIFLGFILALSSVVAQNSEQDDFEISKNLDVFATAYRQLQLNYVDELNPGELMKTALDAMLESLDPYTVYIPESDIEDYRFMTTGQYGGIGALIHKRGEWVYISEPYEGFPADLSGLKAGDKIMEVNGKSAKGKSVDEISAALKGQPGTNVSVLIQRDSTEKPFEKSITRQEIKLENVPYYGFVADGVGYINLSQFMQNSAADVKNAFNKLSEGGTLKGVILDLRGNGGGLLNEAVSLVNIFVDRGQLVVSTRGKLREKNNVHKTIAAAVDTKIPLVVLVDEGSASASEIVAGAIQDLDRGVIIGQRTFGKGLVQNIVPLSYNAEMKVTIAKYYIPSGRCVQEIDYSKNKNVVAGAKDSVAAVFKTKNGRIVKEGHGIDPDIIIESKEYSNISNVLVTKYLLFDYATKFYREHPAIPAAGVFSISDEIYNDFVKFLSGKEYDYVTQSEKSLEKLKQDAEKEKYFDAIKTEYEALKMKMMHNKNEDLVKFRDEIEYMLLLYIVPRYYYQKGRVQASLTKDPEVKEAINILTDPLRYQTILNIEGQGEKGDKK